MKPKHLYLTLAVVGTVLPLSQFLPFLRDHGFHASLFVEQLLATQVGAFFGCSRCCSLWRRRCPGFWN